MYSHYILVAVRRRKLSVLYIFVFDQDDAPKEDSESRDPFTFSENARAYTEHGIAMRRGKHPWGNDGDLFPYSEELHQVFCGFARTNNIDGYAVFFEERARYISGI
jgi:hypothetical protein